MPPLPQSLLFQILFKASGVPNRRALYIENYYSKQNIKYLKTQVPKVVQGWFPNKKLAATINILVKDHGYGKQGQNNFHSKAFK